MRTHVQRTVSRCCAALRQHRQIRAVVHVPDAGRQACPVSARLWQRCAIVGIQAYLLCWVQSVLNAAVRLIFHLKHVDHITDVRSVFTGYECLSAVTIKLRHWHRKFCTVVSWSFSPCSWSSWSAGSTVSKHQSLGGPDLQAFLSRCPDLSGFLITDVERVARRRRNGAVTASLPASTEDKPLPEIISPPVSDISVDIFSGPCGDVCYLGHFKNHWTEMVSTWRATAEPRSVRRTCSV